MDGLEWVAPASQPESKAWIGERYDPETGLQYLNARYYDPKLGLFTQGDWWDPTIPGVGPNRYAYSHGDPVNFSDPNGHMAPVAVGIAIGIGIAIDLAFDDDVTVTDVAISAGANSFGFGLAGLAARGLAVVGTRAAPALGEKAIDLLSDLLGAAIGAVGTDTVTGPVEGVVGAAANKGGTLSPEEAMDAAIVGLPTGSELVGTALDAASTAGLARGVSIRGLDDAAAGIGATAGRRSAQELKDALTGEMVDRMSGRPDEESSDDADPGDGKGDSEGPER